jgi:hypothetical protein
MIYHAAARGIEIEQVESSLSGDLDLRGFLGLDPTVRSGYQTIQIKLRIKANVTEKECRNSAAWDRHFHLFTITSLEVSRSRFD